MKKRKFSKIFGFVALFSFGFAALAGTALSLKNGNEVVETKASDKPVATIDKMGSSDWNGRLDSGGKYYWYLVHGTANFSATDVGSAKYKDVSAAMGDGVKLNGASFVSYGNSLLKINYENGGQYLTIKIPTELIVPMEGVGGCVVSFEAGTEYYDYQLPAFSICIDCNSKRAALNATTVSITGFKLVYDSWFALKIPGYPDFAQWTKSVYLTDYDNIGLSFLDDIYVNGDENQKLLLSRDKMPESKISMTFNVDKSHEGNNISFSTSCLAVQPADITSLTIKQGATFPVQNGDKSFSSTQSFVADETYYLDGVYGYAIKETNVLGAKILIHDSHIGFYLEGADFYGETKSGDVKNHKFNMRNIYYNDDPSKTLQASTCYTNFNSLYDIAQGRPCFGFYGSQIDAGVNTATSITIPAGTQFPNFQTCSKTAGNVVYVTRSEVRLVSYGNNEYFAESLGDSENYGVMTISDFNPGSSGTISSSVAGPSHPFNQMSAIAGKSAAVKFNMTVGGTTASENNFELCESFDVGHYRFKFSTGSTSGSVKIQYGTGAGGWADTTDVSTTKYFSFSNNTTHLFEIYYILVDSTHLRLGFALNHNVLLVGTFKMKASTDIGRIVHMYTYQNGPDVTFTDYTNTSADGVNLFKEKGLLFKEVPTTDHSYTGACKGENGRYAKAKAYYNNYLTTAQKSAFASDSEGVARLSIWAANNGEVFNVSSGTFGSPSISLLQNNNNTRTTLIIVISVITASTLALLIIKKRKSFKSF